MGSASDWGSASRAHWTGQSAGWTGSSTALSGGAQLEKEGDGPTLSEIRVGLGEQLLGKNELVMMEMGPSTAGFGRVLL